MNCIESSFNSPLPKGNPRKALSGNVKKYSRKPLGFVVPFSNESQAKNNPFGKYINRIKSATSVFKNIRIDHEKIPTNSSKFHPKATSPTAQSRTRINFIKLLEPSIFISEPDDNPPEDCPNINSDSKPVKNEKKLFVQVKSVNSDILIKKLSNFPITTEVIRNFNELLNMDKIFIEEVSNKYLYLPQPVNAKKTNKTLLLDLDDTLIHTIISINPFVKISKEIVRNVEYYDDYYNKQISINVAIRPYAIEFIKEMSSLYEIVVNTFIIIRFLLRQGSHMQKT